MKGLVATRVRCRRGAPALALALAGALALLGGSRPARSEAPAQVQAVARTGFTVQDLDAEIAFFRDALGFERVSERELDGEAIERASGVFPARVRVARLRLGSEELELTQYLAPEGRPAPEDTRGNDLWFQHVAIVVSDMARAYAELRAHHVRHVSPGPQRLPDWNPNAGGIEAFYFRDPEGHFLELIYFPPGKGDPRWQRASARLFLGIDHTAITVSDTDASLAFYRDRLGLRVAGGSENYGPEQERLNAVFGAHLRITALRAERGPGIELLEYLAPSGGRPRPDAARANDLLHWQTDLVVTDASSAERALRGGARIDTPVVAVPWVGHALRVADPDGHRMRLVEGEKP